MTQDFASAAMVRLLVEGMRRLGLEPPPEAAPQDAGLGRAHVPLDLKRRVVGAAIAQGGLGCLPLLARGLQPDRHEPVHQALMTARSAGDLFARWQRLERYIHARHRIAVVDQVEPADGESVGMADLLHAAQHGPPPLPAEDLVVLGVLAALLEEIGLQDVTATVDGAAAWPQPDAAALEQRAAAGRTSRWQLRWCGSLGENDAPGTPAPATPGLPPWLNGLPSAWSGATGRAAALLAQDLARPPTVAALAAHLGLSARTLQRTLQTAGTGHADLLARLRCRAAAWWLLHHDLPVAEIGYLCGYADQAHFSRSFRSRVGVPPGSFRQAFQAGRAALP